MWKSRNADKSTGNQTCYVCHKTLKRQYGGLPCSRHKCTHPDCEQPREFLDRTSSWHCSKHTAPSYTQAAVASQPAVIPKPVVFPPPEVISESVVASQPVPHKNLDRCKLCFHWDYMHDTPNSAEKDLYLCTRHRCTSPSCEAPRAKRVLPGNVRQSEFMFAKLNELNEDWLCTNHIESGALPDDGRARLGPAEVNATPREILKARLPPSNEVDPWDRAASEEELAPVKRHSRLRSIFKFVSKEKKAPTHYMLETPSFETTPESPGQFMQKKKLSASKVSSEAVKPTNEVPPVDLKEKTGTDSFNSKTNLKSVLVEGKSFTSPESAIEAEIERVGWHQCHAPACQARVISEDVWVCQKHLEQGYYDQDDPPGFMDDPGSGS